MAHSKREKGERQTVINSEEALQNFLEQGPYFFVAVAFPPYESSSFYFYALLILDSIHHPPVLLVVLTVVVVLSFPLENPAVRRLPVECRSVSSWYIHNSHQEEDLHAAPGKKRSHSKEANKNRLPKRRMGLQ